MFVTELESALDGRKFPADELQTTHKDRPLWVRYDLEKIASAVTKDDLLNRPADIWRWRELLPVPKNARIITLNERTTRLIKTESLQKQIGHKNIWIKDESTLPTGSFKSRGMSMAITMAAHFGVKRIALPTAGNAGGAAAAYAQQADIKCLVFMPEDTPAANQYETISYGASAFLVNGLIDDCSKIVGLAKEKLNCFDLSTLKEPYRIEGKKTMGLELAQQFDWKLPDVILYPTGGGTGLIGMWKAFKELRELGWLKSDIMPRMVAVQSDGCCPIVNAFKNGERFAKPFQNAKTIAWGIRVPAAIGDFMILDALKESNGTAVAVDEEMIDDWTVMTSEKTGLSICPETAACVGALENLKNQNWIHADDRVLIFNTASGQKYKDTVKVELPKININKEINWEIIEASL
ncbi:MAG: threonine synthase [candidate division Zixibacteria bacterium]|nr:threonine synthase [candidate division Zixibacteria bacterium]